MINVSLGKKCISERNIRLKQPSILWLSGYLGPLVIWALRQLLGEDQIHGDGRNCVFGLSKYCLYWPCHYGWERFEFWCWIASNSPWLWSMMCSNCRICYLCYKYNAYDWEGVVLDRKLLLSEKWTSMPSNFENKVYNYAIFTIAFSFFQKPSFLLFYLF